MPSQPVDHFFAYELALFHDLTSSLLVLPSCSGSFSLLAIDEVGRGCLAGPVVSCVSFWQQAPVPAGGCFPLWLPLLRDSKKLSPKKRDHCFSLIMKDFFSRDTAAQGGFGPVCPGEEIDIAPCDLVSSPRQRNLGMTPLAPCPLSGKKNKTVFRCVSFALGQSSAAEVDRHNVWNAVQLASARALLQLARQVDDISPQSVILMDGRCPLRLPGSFASFTQVTAVRADDLFQTVSFSSIVAKVFRDRLMEAQGRLYPQFDFAKHKGYGTKLHFARLANHEPCPLHRLRFLTKFFRQQTSERSSKPLVPKKHP